MQRLLIPCRSGSRSPVHQLHTFLLWYASATADTHQRRTGIGCSSYSISALSPGSRIRGTHTPIVDNFRGVITFHDGSRFGKM